MRKSLYDYPEGCRHYDEGWNWYCEGKEKPEEYSRDFWDGWNDCREAPPEDQVKI